MLTSKRTLRRAFVILLATAAIGVGGSILQSTHVRRQAELFLSKAQQLNVGSSSYEQVLNALQQFQRYQYLSGPCSSMQCELEYHFDNTGVRVLRLVPPTGFYFSFDFHNGLLTGKKAVLGQDVCCVALVRETRFDPGERAGIPAYELIPNGAPYKVLVKLDTRATDEERRIAYQFNLGCLTTVGGCKDAHELLPSVWRRH
jgi:hypothetical protein